MKKISDYPIKFIEHLRNLSRQQSQFKVLSVITVREIDRILSVNVVNKPAVNTKRLQIELVSLGTTNKEAITLTHVFVAILNHESRQIYIFDPSYKPQTMSCYIAGFKQIFSSYEIFSVVHINIQELYEQCGYVDIFCKLWCYHFIYHIFVLGETVDQYVQAILRGCDSRKMTLLSFVKMF